jgi:hypothetical protein
VLGVFYRGGALSLEQHAQGLTAVSRILLLFAGYDLSRARPVLTSAYLIGPTSVTVRADYPLQTHSLNAKYACADSALANG